MSTDNNIRIAVVFPTDDQAWIRRSGIVVPDFWAGHSVPPATGDVLRIGGRQFVIEARVWEHDGAMALLRLFVSSGHAQSDTTFG
ncbi:MAG TPA: hypothetical protein VJO99_18390 [Burkholderiaceae bacterium]|nr:hypothetical protein [Burkholderiaceae bacterium]